jgi:tRNA threonylcarbamoyladenosine biosynthesis protein TsaE
MGSDNEIFITLKSSETKKLAQRFAQKILKIGPKNKAIILSLVGNLGSGKTIFIQGFAKELGIKEKVLSPTFVIFKKHKIESSTNSFRNFYHFDCYRIKKASEVLTLGFKEIISHPENIVAIEWADKIKRILPKGSISIFFVFLGKNKRKIIFK